MPAEAVLSMQNKTFASGKLSREAIAELTADYGEMKKDYQKKLMKMEELKQTRRTHTRAIRAIKDQVNYLEGGMIYIKRKIGRKDE